MRMGRSWLQAQTVVLSAASGQSCTVLTLNRAWFWDMLHLAAEHHAIQTPLQISVLRAEELPAPQYDPLPSVGIYWKGGEST